MLKEISGEVIPEQEVRQELDRILRSPTFERAERLQRFLRFVCELTLRGEASRINEYLIGSEVFERGADYSPHEDSVVRRQAHSLRRKLQQYYETDGRDSLLRIELPVGHYVAVFRRRDEEAEAASAPAPSERRPLRKQWMALAALAAGAVLFAAGWILGSRGASAPGRLAASEVLGGDGREIWGPWLDDPAGAIICFSNPLTAVIKQLPVPQPPDAVPRRLPLTSDQEKFFRETINVPPGGYLYLSPAISQAKMGEAIAAVRLTTLFARSGVPVKETQSRFLTWEDLRAGNYIILGHNEASQWVDILLQKLPFQLEATHGNRPRSIVNRQPEQDQQGRYVIHYGGNRGEPTEEYALVSMIPGVDGRRALLLISGLNTQATQAAAEYLTSSPGLTELASRLRALKPGHRGPWHFQGVLRTEVHDKVPTRAALVALRVI